MCGVHTVRDHRLKADESLEQAEGWWIANQSSATNVILWYARLFYCTACLMLKGPARVYICVQVQFTPVHS